MVRTFAPSPTLYLGTVGPNGEHELYDGKLRFMDTDGNIIQDRWTPKNYLDFICRVFCFMVLPQIPLLQTFWL